MPITYLKTFLHAPLTIARMRETMPDISRHLLNGLEAASFPLARADFHAVLEGLGASVEDMSVVQPSTDLSELSRRYAGAAPEIREIVSKRIERGPAGDRVKRAAGFRCQICGALGAPTTTFLKPDGTPYVEAHHVVPVRHRQLGSLAPENVIAVCPNHHRELHYGVVEIVERDDTIEFMMAGRSIIVPRLARIGASSGPV